MQHNYTALECVIINENFIDSLLEVCQRKSYQSLFVLLSNSVNIQADLVSRLTALEPNLIIHIGPKIGAHTPRDDVLNALVQANQIQPDVVVAIGGGSIIDAAKTVQFALNLKIETEAQLDSFAQYADGTKGENRHLLDKEQWALNETVRTIAIPTTLSGAEFSNNASVLNKASASKEGYRTQNLFPQTVIYDPQLCQHTPMSLWLSTAIRSIDHAIEGYCSPKSYPYLDGQFLHALHLFSNSLPAIKANPQNSDARTINHQAVWLACCGLNKVTHGASHGIGYALGAICDLPHGICSCVMLPAVLRWNESVNQDKQKIIANALGKPNVSASQAVKELIAQLELPTSLSEAGVKREQFQVIAESAYRHPVVRANPKQIGTAEQVLQILELAW